MSSPVTPATALACLKQLRPIVDSLLARSDSTVFAAPVDWRNLELWDYVSIVKEPMDLGTVRSRMEETIAQAEVMDGVNGTIVSAADKSNDKKTYQLTGAGVLNVLQDVRLTFRNCLL